MNLFWMPAQLAVLAKVVDLNGFSAAARALDVPKAAVSRAIADLERALGVPVLTRTTRRLALTEAGRIVYPHARRLVEESDAARGRIAKLLSPPSGPLRVAADPTWGRVLLAPLVPRFMESFPDIPLEVDLQGEAGDNWEVAVRAGPMMDNGERLDQGHRPVMDPGHSPVMDQGRRPVADNDECPPEDYCHRLLGSPPAILCATPAYLQKRGLPQMPEDLRDHDLLTPEGEAPEYRLLLERGAQRAELRLSPKLAVNDPAVLHAATAASLGVGLLPQFLCRQGLATGRLNPVLPQWQLPRSIPLYAVFPALLGADPRVLRFVDFLAANVVPALADA